MAAPQQAGLPPFFTLSSGMVVRLTALDATTGAVVTGVQVGNVAISIDKEAIAGPVLIPSPVTGAYTSAGPV
jgi:hypothetical protein